MAESPIKACFYPIAFFNCLIVKIEQDKRIINKSVYITIRYWFVRGKSVLICGLAKMKCGILA